MAASSVQNIARTTPMVAPVELATTSLTVAARWGGRHTARSRWRGQRGADEQRQRPRTTGTSRKARTPTGMKTAMFASTSRRVKSRLVQPSRWTARSRRSSRLGIVCSTRAGVRVRRATPMRKGSPRATAHRRVERRGGGRSLPMRSPLARHPDTEKAAPAGGLLVSLVGVTGFEPATSSSRTKRATKLRHTRFATLRVYSEMPPAPNRALPPAWRIRLAGQARGVRVSSVASGRHAKRTGA